MKLRALLAAGGVLAAMTPAHAQTLVEFASLAGAQGGSVQLKAHWYAVAAPKAAAVVLLHGCGGMYDRKGQVSQRMRDYAALLNQQGLHALLVDSLTPRGETEICTQRTGTRKVTLAQRRLDALAALQWLAQRPEVNAQRIGLMGWSNGGSTVLSATNTRHTDVAALAVKPAFAVAFYPGCEVELKRGYAPVAPLLMLVGEADDWTAAAPCQQLSAKAMGPKVEIETYAGAYHGFDSAAPVRLRQDVPNGVKPGHGVHVGGNADAWRRSRERLLVFLQAYRNSPALPQNTR
ncbi:MAG: dienelactone hydrolase family protein [Cytophagales bacterium]|nr:dienelactone hydrolase family protein [Rhizobacter sp.]